MYVGVQAGTCLPVHPKGLYNCLTLSLERVYTLEKHRMEVAYDELSILLNPICKY